MQKNSSKLLITGISTGFGRYLHENLKGFGLKRDNFSSIRNKKFDVIIHSAFNTSRQYQGLRLATYSEDNIFLTKSLIDLPSKKFIYISSIDIYPKELSILRENLEIDIDKVSGIYAVSKLISETLVQKYMPNHLILRLSALLGKYSRPNSLLKIIKNREIKLNLSAESIFNYISYEDVLSFIKYAIKQDLSGIFNLASVNNISLDKSAQLIKKKLGPRKIEFGDFYYKCGNIDISKITKVPSFIPKSSETVIMKFIANN